jgi:diaminohydroxyphosphoribosylaminopyrimidine deaminase/5-amino-6-(5-phosphoribosylamino)uracil reductase
MSAAERQENEDGRWMQRALELAERGRGWVEPNPLVGAVVIRDGRLVGEGWHRRFGEAHAEIEALTSAGESARGANMYVTLEPCCHHGKTPPCTEAIIQAGIQRVVASMTDPFPQVAGKGIERLRSAGVVVEVGSCESNARRLNAPYLKLVRQGQPYVHAKWAMTLDGKIATRTGESQWISNEESRQRVHEMRGRMDAIVVGVNTAIADNPQLTARPPGPRTAIRIVLDSQARLPPTSRLVETARDITVLVAVAETAPAASVATLEQAGCEALRLPAEGNRVPVKALLDELGRRRFTNILVEGGAEVLGSFLDNQ